MLTLLILENLLLIAVVYFLVTAYGINMSHLKAFMSIITDRVKDYYYEYKFNTVKRIVSTYKSAVSCFKK